jgi:hypothetical protein
MVGDNVRPDKQTKGAPPMNTTHTRTRITAAALLSAALGLAGFQLAAGTA